MYRKKAHVHFMGIGGIGMSGIATILKAQGFTVSGCDQDILQKSVIDLKASGCSIEDHHNSSICQDSSIDVLVYSSAIQADNQEILLAQQRSIPVIPRALMLAELMRTKFSIAVAGSHGKTTTTSMVSHILIESKLDPTVIIGGHLIGQSTNAQLGKGDFLVAEADESDRSFLKLQATLGIVTNIDLEHLETYKDLDDIKQTYMQFLNNLPFYGKAIMCIDDPVIQSLMPLTHIKTIKYGLSKTADLYAKNIDLQPAYSTFDLYKKDCTESLGTIKINMPGKHNILNCLAAIAVSLDLKVPFTSIAAALDTFKGIERRFSYCGSFKGAEFFDDYGHHPREIESTLKVARKRSKNKLHVFFQPHRYSRTFHLWKDFLRVFEESNIDSLVITDIYAASESPIEGVSSKKFVEALLAQNPSFKVTYIPYENDLSSLISQAYITTDPDDLLLFLGAGKINTIFDKLK
ncbi:MAG TPA: UDP-N-acetylmuramate--L-alanine ligase [Candidatus Babeliales bacterium]|nr:UDP-N-acetylmuramate--L-alanine ligase [Candidatus Babeliales bacterium]